MSTRNLEIIIDEIVVHGASGLDRDRFRARVEQELGRILQEEGGLPGLTEPTGLRAAALVQTITAAPGQTPSAAHVARAIHGALKG
jgi:hypothetical protein